MCALLIVIINTLAILYIKLFFFVFRTFLGPRIFAVRMSYVVFCLRAIRFLCDDKSEYQFRVHIYNVGVHCDGSTTGIGVAARRWLV